MALAGCALAPVSHDGGDAPRTAVIVPLKAQRPVLGAGGARGFAHVDGGVASRVPAALARDMGADVVVAADISRRPADDAEAADVVIRPQTVRSRINDFQYRQANITAGEEAARAAVSDIRERIEAVAARKARTAGR